MLYALRALGRSPGYAATCVAVIALGIGANAAIFSVVHSVILRSLPFEDPSRLVFVWERYPMFPDFGERIDVRRASYLEWKRQATAFVDMAAFAGKKLTETGAGQPRHVLTGFASANLFATLGVNAGAGRLFRADEERPGADHVAILSDPARAEMIGRSITLGETAYTVIGVLPRKFHLPATGQGTDQMKAEIWVPLSRFWNKPDDDSSDLHIPARLKPGVSLEQARTEMAGIAARLAIANPKSNEGIGASVYPVELEDASPTLHRALFVLLAAVGFLLLIACANLANLTLARATLRSREIAVRLALGATRGRIVGQLVTESLMVATAGAAVGLLLARWSIQLMLALKPDEIQRPELIAINLPVFGFAAAATILTALLFGLGPAISVSRADLTTALKSGGGWGASAARSWSRQCLIAIEVALALALATGAGLMIRSFHELVATGVGFETAHLSTIDVDLLEKRYPDVASRSRFFRKLIERARAIPGVSGAGVIDNLPLHDIGLIGFYIPGRPEPPPDSIPVADSAQVSPETFGVLGVRLEAGRLFTYADLANDEKGGDRVAIVNRAFARKFFDGDDPIGKRLLTRDKKRASQIVGVVSDFRPLGVEKGTRPEIFYPYLGLKTATLVARTTLAPQAITKSLQDAARAMDREVVVSKVGTMEEYVDRSQSQRKFNTLLMAVFAGLALILAMMGIYGVLANLVASRVREIGIRLAIGATPAAIGRLVLRQSMIPVAIGLVIGIAGSLALGRFLEALLFQVRPRDPLTLTVATCTILLVSPAAIYSPLRRATKVDCAVALREE